MHYQTASSSPAQGPSVSRTPRVDSNERGVVLLWTALSLLLIMGIIVAGMGKIKALDKISDVEFTGTGHAREIARAGLTDAYAWFRRQQIQPVYAFAPQLDLAADPVVNETEDPSIGIVRTVEISPGYWGRYEVRHGVAAETFDDLDGDGVYTEGEPVIVDLDGDGKWTPSSGTRDVSGDRDVLGAGANWILHSRGLVFRVVDESIPVDVLPNRRIATAVLETEIRRLAYAPPAQAAICAPNGGEITLGNNARIRGGEDDLGAVQYATVAHAYSTGAPINSGAEVYGPITGVPDYRGDVTDVFGVSHNQLRGMSDIGTSDPDNDLPNPMPDSAMVYVEGTANFTADRPLRGSGILVIKGNLNIGTGSNSFYQGMIYVDGDITINGPSYFRGQIIATGSVHVYGSTGDFSEIEYDATMSTLVMRRLGQYRYAKAPYTPLPKLGDGRPDERHIGGIRRQTNLRDPDSP